MYFVGTGRVGGLVHAVLHATPPPTVSVKLSVCLWSKIGDCKSWFLTYDIPTPPLARLRYLRSDKIISK